MCGRSVYVRGVHVRLTNTLQYAFSRNYLQNSIASMLYWLSKTTSTRKQNDYSSVDLFPPPPISNNLKDFSMPPNHYNSLLNCESSLL